MIKVETCDLYPAWILKSLYMPVYKMKVLTSSAIFISGYPILKMDIARKVLEKDS